MTLVSLLLQRLTVLFVLVSFALGVAFAFAPVLHAQTVDDDDSSTVTDDDVADESDDAVDDTSDDTDDDVADESDEESGSGDSSNLSALLTQLQSLMARVQELQQQLAEVRGEVRDMIREGIEEGMTGEDIREIQEILASDSDIYPEGLVTGYFGPLTRSAIRRFQERNDLEATGEIDEETKAALEALIEVRRKDGTVPSGLLRAPGVQKQFERRLLNACDGSDEDNDRFCLRVKEKYGLSKSRKDAYDDDDDSEDDESYEDGDDDDSEEDMSSDSDDEMDEDDDDDSDDDSDDGNGDDDDDDSDDDES